MYYVHYRLGIFLSAGCLFVCLFVYLFVYFLFYGMITLFANKLSFRKNHIQHMLAIIHEYIHSDQMRDNIEQ